MQSPSTQPEFPAAAADAATALRIARRIVERLAPGGFDETGEDPAILIGAPALIIALRLPVHSANQRPAEEAER
ncbi:MAG TPA: hypothetical protein PLR37_08920 [Candidatus Accumulibacter phosphatis]|nr:hypothetical protein [Candidatus Accumulibacter phosphatis]